MCRPSSTVAAMSTRACWLVNAYHHELMDALRTGDPIRVYTSGDNTRVTEVHIEHVTEPFPDGRAIGWPRGTAQLVAS
jgi:hypothetical protein